MLLLFGFTHCPDVCPASLSRLAAVMKQYLAPLSPKFIGLTGNPKTVAATAAEFSAVFFKGLASDRAADRRSGQQKVSRVPLAAP